MINKLVCVGLVDDTPRAVHSRVSNELSFCTFTVITKEMFRNKDGINQEVCEHHKVRTNKHTTQFVLDRIKKGMLVYVEGPCKTNRYTNKDGVDIAQKEMHLTQINILDSRSA